MAFARLHFPRFVRIASRCVLALVVFGLPAPAPASSPAGDGGAAMVRIPAGMYTLLYSPDKKPEKVKAFLLDERAVTNKEFYEFVRENPEWSRGVSPLFAEKQYLQHWVADRSQPAEDTLDSPVSNVSWFAARHFCAWRGKRLPTLAEWELAAQASETSPQAQSDPAFNARILAWYSVPTPPRLPPVKSGFRNFWGVYDMHGVLWEWVLDFNSVMVTGESRQDNELERDLFCGSGAVAASDEQKRNYAAFIRFALRGSLQGKYCLANLGFRCAKDV